MMERIRRQIRRSLPSDTILEHVGPDVRSTMVRLSSDPPTNPSSASVACLTVLHVIVDFAERHPVGLRAAPHARRHETHRLLKVLSCETDTGTRGQLPFASLSNERGDLSQISNCWRIVISVMSQSVRSPAMNDLSIRPSGGRNLVSRELGAAEGWNPGFADAACSPRPIREGSSSASLKALRPQPSPASLPVRASPSSASTSVREDLRGRGYGLRI